MSSAASPAMSLYYDAASILSVGQEGSLKSRIYDNNSTLKSKPAHLYALISETAKCDVLLKEIIENAGILVLEPKLTPLLSLLLVHDHCFSKGGIAAPTNHSLRQAIERHKARIQAELTKSRLRRKCATIDELKKLSHARSTTGSTLSQPRWVRVNRIKSSVSQQLETTFAGYTTAFALTEVIGRAPLDKVLYIDDHVPDLLAVPAGVDLIKTVAYKNGEIILQDKASCFPAQLLLGSASNTSPVLGDILDGCAAPGNKTTHLASIVTAHGSTRSKSESKIFACERDQRRSRTLQKMVEVAGAEKIVTVLPEQDFLLLDPEDQRFENVTHLLLDPSCSGSGIVGREDIPILALPEDRRASSSEKSNGSKKRKRDEKAKDVSESQSNGRIDEEEEPSKLFDGARLEKLSNLQSKIIEHAFAFPVARFITYSTCSTYSIENESVIARVVRSPIALARGWRVLKRTEQAEGLRLWPKRGVFTSTSLESESPVEPALDEAELQGCLRCEAGNDDGTMGFFVCMFVKDETLPSKPRQSGNSDLPAEEEWEGFGSD